MISSYICKRYNEIRTARADAAQSEIFGTKTTIMLPPISSRATN